MRKTMMLTCFVVSIVVLLVCSSLPVYADEFVDDSAVYMDVLGDVDEELLDEIDALVRAGFGVYLTISSSQERRAFHVFFPFLMRLVKARGIFLSALIVHRTINARTMVFEFSATGIRPVKTELGRHMVFIIGLGYTAMSRPFYSGGGEVYVLSLTKPLVIL